jgi:diguanylate cyclase (GGDEF)-like protein
MHVLSWFDNRTLIACDLLLAAIFSVVFLSMKRVYPSLRGVGSVAMSFLLAVPGTFLIASRGSLSYFASVMIAHSFIFGSFIFLYRGILRFIGSRRTLFVPCLVSGAAMAILYYYSQVQENVVPRVVALSITVGLIRGLIALELFRKSPTFTSPTSMRLFAATMSFFAAVSVNCGVMTLLHGSPTNSLQSSPASLQSSPVGTATLLLGVIFVCLTGLFVLILSSNELIARSRDESQKDVLSGAFNRRGIEVKLAAELKHIHRGKQKLSVALIDVDYFKAINDFQGHAAGDAALRDVVDAITSRLRGRDYLGRYGGDEFLLILPQTAASIALVIADRLSQTVAEMSLSGRSQPLTLSVGLAEAIPGDDVASLIGRADKALYQAKSDGRNCRRVATLDEATPAIVEAVEEDDSSPMGGILMPGIEPPMLQQ